MANNRLYIVVREPDEEPRQILLAKGYASGWDIWEPETLEARFNNLIADYADISSSIGGSKTTISIEDENHQADHPKLIRKGELKR